MAEVQGVVCEVITCTIPYHYRMQLSSLREMGTHIIQTQNTFSYIVAIIRHFVIILVLLVVFFIIPVDISLPILNYRTRLSRFFGFSSRPYATTSSGLENPFLSIIPSSLLVCLLLADCSTDPTCDPTCDYKLQSLSCHSHAGRHNILLSKFSINCHPGYSRWHEVI